MQVVTSPCCPRQLPDIISESPSLDAGPHAPAARRVLAPVSSTASSAFPLGRLGRRPASIPRMTTSRRASFRGCRYFVMFRPPSLLAPRIVPTAANTAAGQLGLLRPSLSCFVASARPGYANRPKTGNWRYGDLHPARLSALSAAPNPTKGYGSSRTPVVPTCSSTSRPSRRPGYTNLAEGARISPSGFGSRLSMIAQRLTFSRYRSLIRGHEPPPPIP